MKKRNMRLGATIRDYLSQHPDASTNDVMAATGAKTKQQVYQAKTYMKLNAIVRPAPAATVENGQPRPLEMAISLPDGGIRLQVREGQRMGFTLGITHKGIRFTPVNGRKDTENVLPWHLVRALADAGIKTE